MKRLALNQIHFIVNKEKRTVCAYATDIQEIIIDEVCKKISNSEFVIISDLFFDVPKSVHGIAHCAPSDEWNEEIGKRIALSRLNRSYARIQLKVVKRLINFLENVEVGLHKEYDLLTQRANKFSAVEDFSMCDGGEIK